MSLRTYLKINNGDEYSFFAKKHGLTRPPRTLDDVKKYFEKLRDGVKKNELLAVELAASISYNACRQNIWREHEAAKFIERFVERFLGGILTSPKNRPPVPPLPPLPDNVRRNLPDVNDFLQNVRRAALEKTDLYFPETKLRISLKSLVPDNNEINAGSFPPRLLFAGFLKTIPEERKGMGSRTRLLQIFKQLQEKGAWQEFVERFKYMLDAIYDDIHLVVIERYPLPRPKLIIYLISSDKFRSLLKELVDEGPESLTRVLYRFELHSMRLVKSEVIAVGEKVEVELVDYNDSPLIKYLNKIGDLYHKRLLTGRVSIDDFKNEVTSIVTRFLSEVEDMLKRTV